MFFEYAYLRTHILNMHIHGHTFWKSISMETHKHVQYPWTHIYMCNINGSIFWICISTETHFKYAYLRTHILNMHISGHTFWRCISMDTHFEHVLPLICIFRNKSDTYQRNSKVVTSLIIIGVLVETIAFSITWSQVTNKVVFISKEERNVVHSWIWI